MTKNRYGHVGGRDGTPDGTLESHQHKGLYSVLQNCFYANISHRRINRLQMTESLVLVRGNPHTILMMTVNFYQVGTLLDNFS